MAEQFGADFLIRTDERPLEVIRDITEGKGVDTVIEFVGYVLELLQVICLVEQEKIKPVISKMFPFKKANEALWRL